MASVMMKAASRLKIERVNINTVTGSKKNLDLLTIFLVCKVGWISTNI